MHAKPDLRVFLKWMIAGSGSVITDVICLRLAMPETVASNRYKLVSRIALAMVVLSASYFVISFPFWLPVKLPDDFPNSIAAKWKSENFTVGALSHHRMSCLFFSTAYDTFDTDSRWSERRDGHFCSFDVPPIEAPQEPPGFIFSLNKQTIGWNLPYWVMVVLWGAIYLKTRNRTFAIIDLLLVVFVFALIFGATTTRHGLFLVVPMNLLTVATMVALTFQGVRLIWSNYPSGRNVAIEKIGE